MNEAYTVANSTFPELTTIHISNDFVIDLIKIPCDHLLFKHFSIYFWQFKFSSRLMFKKIRLRRLNTETTIPVYRELCQYQNLLKDLHHWHGFLCRISINYIQSQIRNQKAQCHLYRNHLHQKRKIIRINSMQPLFLILI